MTDHAERIAAVRSAIDYTCGRTDQEQAVPGHLANVVESAVESAYPAM